jgi:hypothetical protein
MSEINVVGKDKGNGCNIKLKQFNASFLGDHLDMTYKFKHALTISEINV